MEYNKVFYGDAYCVKCKDKVTFEGQIKVSDSGRRMAFGKCPQCGTKVNRILGKEPFQEKPINMPQPAVTPRPLPYATIAIYKDGWRWKADVKDDRRIGDKKYEYFWSTNKNALIKEATQWIESYKVIEFFRGAINGQLRVQVQDR